MYINQVVLLFNRVSERMTERAYAMQPLVKVWSTLKREKKSCKWSVFVWANPCNSYVVVFFCFFFSHKKNIIHNKYIIYYVLIAFFLFALCWPVVDSSRVVCAIWAFCFHYYYFFVRFVCVHYAQKFNQTVEKKTCIMNTCVFYILFFLRSKINEQKKPSLCQLQKRAQSHSRMLIARHLSIANIGL